MSNMQNGVNYIQSTTLLDLTYPFILLSEEIKIDLVLQFNELENKYEISFLPKLAFSVPLTLMYTCSSIPYYPILV